MAIFNQQIHMIRFETKKARRFRRAATSRFFGVDYIYFLLIYARSAITFLMHRTNVDGENSVRLLHEARHSRAKRWWTFRWNEAVNNHMYCTEGREVNWDRLSARWKFEYQNRSNLLFSTSFSSCDSHAPVHVHTLFRIADTVSPFHCCDFGHSANVKSFHAWFAPFTECRWMWRRPRHFQRFSLSKWIF